MSGRTPLRIYLDTSDYGVLYRDPKDADLQRVLDLLLSKKEAGEIEIGFSYPVLWELLQDFSEGYRADRIQRAECLKTLCGRNAYRYLPDLKEGDALSREGHWYPDIEQPIGVAALKRIWIEQFTQNRDVVRSRAHRNALKNPRRFRKIIRDNPQLCDLSGIDLEGFPVTDEFIRKNVFHKYMIGDITEEDADREFLKVLTDPVIFVGTWFDYGGKVNPFTDDVHQTSRGLRTRLEALQKLFAETERKIAEINKLQARAYKNDLPAEIIRELKESKKRLREAINLGKDIKSPKLMALLDDHMLEVVTIYFESNLERPSAISDSDFADILHTAYIPHVDLWRGDSKFSRMLIRGQIAQRNKIVPTLRELPARIDQLLGRETRS